MAERLANDPQLAYVLASRHVLLTVKLNKFKELLRQSNPDLTALVETSDEPSLGFSFERGLIHYSFCISLLLGELSTEIVVLLAAVGSLPGNPEVLLSKTIVFTAKKLTNGRQFETALEVEKYQLEYQVNNHNLNLQITNLQVVLTIETNQVGADGKNISKSKKGELFRTGNTFYILFFGSELDQEQFIELSFSDGNELGKNPDNRLEKCYFKLEVPHQNTQLEIKIPAAVVYKATDYEYSGKRSSIAAILKSLG